MTIADTTARRAALLAYAGTAGRLLLAGVLLWAGLAKIGDLAASVRAVKAYQIMPSQAAEVVGAALPMVEIAVGLLLIVGLTTRVAAGAAAVLLWPLSPESSGPGPAACASTVAASAGEVSSAPPSRRTTGFTSPETSPCSQ